MLLCVTSRKVFRPQLWHSQTRVAPSDLYSEERKKQCLCVCVACSVFSLLLPFPLQSVSARCQLCIIPQHILHTSILYIHICISAHRVDWSKWSRSRVCTRRNRANHDAIDDGRVYNTTVPETHEQKTTPRHIQNTYRPREPCGVAKKIARRCESPQHDRSKRFRNK